jgi:FkbM family methyltransferase
MEPVASSFEQLIDNLRLNQALHLVDAQRVAAGDRRGSVCVTDRLGAMNRVVDAGWAAKAHTHVVPMRTVDEVLAGKAPAIIKIDVEGFEHRVVGGAMQTLRNASVLAVLVEKNWRVGCSADRATVEQQMHACGYQSYRYQGLARRLERADYVDRQDANTIFARSVEPLLERIESARRFRVLDTEV